MPRKAPTLSACIAGLALGIGNASAADVRPHIQVGSTGQAQTSVGVDIAASALTLRGGLTARNESGRSHVAPQLRSEVEFAPRVKLETRIDFGEWNSQSALMNPGFEVKLRLRPVLPFIDEIEGGSWRAPDGLPRHTVRVTAAEDLAVSGTGRPITLRTSATIEQTGPALLPESTVTGMEAALSGFGKTTAQNRVGLSYRARSGATADRMGSISFGRSWQVNEYGQFAIDCRLVDTNEQRDQRIGLSWQGEF